MSSKSGDEEERITVAAARKNEMHLLCIVQTGAIYADVAG